MYTEVIPFVEKFLRKRQTDLLGEIFAKCYYAERGAACVGDRNIIVLEDVVPRGSTLSDEPLVLDYDHCALALRQLARFHAMFYGMKKQETSRFHAMVKNIRAQDFGQRSHGDMNYFFKTTSYRAVQHLVELMEPKEPLAVLCHGDFSRNNILFRYESGKPCDAVLCDLQNVKYASPAIDLSLFMYLNTSSELRNQHWDDLFGEYHATLTRTLPRIQGSSVEKLSPDYGLDEFQKDFVAHGFHGYMICSFFLAKTMEDQKDPVDLAIVLKENIYECGSLVAGYGGESASRCLADILKHFESLGAL
jgi:hypothetical protein